ncbi:type VI secretion system ImpA family N-terminal domain-containing protein [Moellerella wisconsensis]|uniref:type VI secretion system protein TssA n=1 Tax=Moellerella wisconsensis TaxID=158849 RepID=UPI001F4D6A62|nr:type VI secretion system ImpA family N-terminal domain-containing protein [Moellerella wisconsensis]UNH26406.1 type VI secretion system ImpA family N-terminal domain-containing protein [Moellerella wisconsensis]
MLIKSDDIELLLVPITNNSPQGVYLKEDNVLYRPLRNLFNISQTSLRKLISNPQQDEIDILDKENKSHWNKLSEELLSIFKYKARDLSLIGWFLCSQIVLDSSFKSLQLSLSWLEILLTEQWESLQPNIENSNKKDSLECEQIKYKELELFLGDSIESCLFYTPFMLSLFVGRVSFYQYTQAERRGESAALKQSLVSTVKQEQQVIRQKQQTLLLCVKSLHHIQTILNKSEYQKNKSSFLFFIKIIESYIKGLDNISQGIIASIIEPEVNNIISDNQIIDNSLDYKEVKSANSFIGLNSGNINDNSNFECKSRQLAFLQLREIAHYFRINEPHSPISFLIEKSIRWGQLSLKELWQEILADKNDNFIERIFNITGVNETEWVELPKVTATLMQNARDINNEFQPAYYQTVNIETTLTEDPLTGDMTKKDSQPAEDKSALRW